MSRERILKNIFFAAFCLLSISQETSASSETRLLKTDYMSSETEDRRCYRPKWFTEGQCKLSEAAHRLRAIGGNASCNTHPLYDCNSIYLATEGPSRHTVRSLTGFCKENNVTAVLESRNNYFVMCPFQYVCRHNSSRIPSTFWEAERLFDQGSSDCKKTLGSSARCIAITPDVPFLVNQGCDDNVGQNRYQLEAIPIVQGYACVRQ
jgi:hypothetical protein